MIAGDRLCSISVFDLSSSSFSREQLPLLTVLLAAGSLTAMTGGLVSPVFPEVVDALRVDPSWAGILVSMHTLTIALFSPIFGILSDRIGKRQVLVTALLLYAIFGAAGALATGFWSMLATRALVGAASGGIAAASIGLLGTMYEGEMRSRILGYATSALATTSIFFPLLGGWIGSFRWQYSFLMYGMGIPVAIASLVILSSGASSRGQTVQLPAGEQQQALLRTLKSSRVLKLYGALILASGVFYIVIVYAPLFFKQAIDADPVLNGAILASRAIGAAIVSAVGASRLSKAIGQSGAIAVGFVLMGVMLLTIPSLTQISLILLTAVVFGAGYGLVMPTLYDALSVVTSVELRTSVLAIGTGMANLGQFISPILLGAVWKYGGITVFFLGGGVSIAIALASVLRRSR